MISRSQRTGCFAAIAMAVAIEPRYVCGAATLVGTCTQKGSQNTRPTADCAGIEKAEKNRKIRS